jgi:exportin-1
MTFKAFLEGKVKSISAYLLFIISFLFSSAQIRVIIKGFFDLDQNLSAFKEHLRDFLVQIKEYGGNDTSDLFLEEREEALKKAAEDKRRIQESVPGILNPHELPEDMQD